MALTYQDKHRIIKEAYRNYTSLRDYALGLQKDSSTPGNDIIEYAVETKPGSGKYKQIIISYQALKQTLEEVKLPPRKRQAFYLNVLEDKLQREVADIMGITTVSVGQYVDGACEQLAEHYFADDEE